jgi:hypothetical protein
MIRVAETADASAIAGILVGAWQTAYTGIVDPGYRSNYVSTYTTEVYDDSFPFCFCIHWCFRCYDQ